MATPALRVTLETLVFALPALRTGIDTYSEIREPAGLLASLGVIEVTPMTEGLLRNNASHAIFRAKLAVGVVVLRTGSSVLPVLMITSTSGVKRLNVSTL